MHFFVLTLLALLAVPASAADYVREKNWADEIVPAIVVGDPLYLGPVNEHRFLALYTEAVSPKAAVIVVHGLGVHPDWNLIGALRTGLADQGYTTLSVQMPVLAADAKSADYAATFGEASERLGTAANFLVAKGYRKIAIVSHSMGSRMSLHYMSGHPAAPVNAWVAIGLSGEDGYGKVRVPVLDLFGDNDLPGVLRDAGKRAASFRIEGSKQVVAPHSDHFFNNRESELVDCVRDYLDHTLAARQDQAVPRR